MVKHNDDDARNNPNIMNDDDCKFKFLRIKNDIDRDGNINKPATDGTFNEILVNNVLLCEDIFLMEAHRRSTSDMAVC